MSETLVEGDAVQRALIPGFVVNYTPVAMAQRAANFRAKGRARLVGLAIQILITVGLYFWFEPATSDWFFWLLAAGVVYSLVLVVVPFVKMRRARTATSRVENQPALKVSPAGLLLATRPEGEMVSWEELTSLKGVNKFFCPGPQLAFCWGDGRRWSVPIILLDALPGTIDQAIRAYSRGRFGLDLSAVDELW